MECKYESPVKVVLNSSQAVYERITNFSLMGQFLPQDKIKDWRADADSCSFSVDGAGEIGLRIESKIPYEQVKYTSAGASKLNLSLWVQLKEMGPYDSRVKVTLKIDLNPMMKMVVGKYMQKFVDQLAEGIAKSI